MCIYSQEEAEVWRTVNIESQPYLYCSTAKGNSIMILQDPNSSLVLFSSLVEKQPGQVCLKEINRPAQKISAW